MEINTIFDAENNIRKHKVIGSLSKSFLFEKLNEIYSSSDFKPDMNSFWDFSSADITALTLDDIYDIANFIKDNRVISGQNKSAVVANDILENYLAQKCANQFEDHASNNVKVFKKQEEAFDWLTS